MEDYDTFPQAVKLFESLMRTDLSSEVKEAGALAMALAVEEGACEFEALNLPKIQDLQCPWDHRFHKRNECYAQLGEYLHGGEESHETNQSDVERCGSSRCV